MFFNSPDYLERVANAVKNIKVHDHTCSIYETRDEQFAVIAPFIRYGLENNEKCIYVADENTAEEVFELLEKDIPDLKCYMEKNAFSILGKKEVYLKTGSFSPELVIEAIKENVSTAKLQGFKAFRVTGEMTWALSGDPGTERLMEYESQVNRLYEELDAVAVCQYNRNRFSSGMIRHILYTHPVIIYKGAVCRNYKYIPPEEYLGPDIESAEINRTLGQILEIEKREESLVGKNFELQTVNEKLNSEIEMHRVTGERLLKTLQELERSNRELEQFAYVASHDLQEPIRMVSVYTKMLEKLLEGRLDERASQCLFFLSDGSRRMHALVQDLLAYSRLTSAIEPFTQADLNEITAEVMRDLQLAITDHKAEIEIGELPVLTADATQMRQLFQNLLQNAIKFKGGADPVISIKAERNGHEWHFTVSDNGIGISPEYSNRIFVIFQRLHEKEKYPGTGIGLSVCKKIVERHGGKIWVESEEGKGSRFHFTISTDLKVQ
ncbi:MAG TPA: MEDS domain-containing protein [Ignavibacteriales bacterium]|nr:MEDS domain-containing protein [Ignavibacteriales bacterium]